MTGNIPAFTKSSAFIYFTAFLAASHSKFTLWRGITLRHHIGADPEVIWIIIFQYTQKLSNSRNIQFLKMWLHHMLQSYKIFCLAISVKEHILYFRLWSSRLWHCVVTSVLEGPVTSSFRVEDFGSRFLQNISNQRPQYIIMQGIWSESSPPWKHQISHFFWKMLTSYPNYTQGRP
jgi:hypothetical protein